MNSEPDSHRKPLHRLFLLCQSGATQRVILRWHLARSQDRAANASAAEKGPTQKNRAWRYEESGHQQQPQARASAHDTQQKALPSRITAFAASTLH